MYSFDQSTVYGAMSYGIRLGHRWGRNGKFCVAVDPAIRTAGISGWNQCKLLAFNFSRPSGLYGMYTSLIGSNPRRFLVTDVSQHEMFLFLLSIAVFFKILTSVTVSNIVLQILLRVTAVPQSVTMPSFQFRFHSTRCNVRPRGKCSSYFYFAKAACNVDSGTEITHKHSQKYTQWIKCST